MRLNLVLFVCISLLRSVLGWGRDGHREVARIAFRKTTNKGRKFLKAHGIDSIESFAEASLWADTDEATLVYPGSDELHFSNTPWRNCQPFVYERDCGYGGSGACIVSGIEHAVLRAIDTSFNKSMRLDAIKFVSHLVADIHQPLHTGFAEDRGGVQIGLLMDDESSSISSLHELWDYGLLERFRGETGESAIPTDPEISVKLTPENLQAKIFDYASALASESSTMFTCQVAYQLDDGTYIPDKSTPSDEYMRNRSRIASMRLRTAGRRLGELIDIMANAFVLSDALGRAGAGAPALPVADPSMALQNNYFAILTMDFDPEEFCSGNDSRSGPDTVGNTTEESNTTIAGSDSAAPLSPVICGRNLTDIIMVKVRGRYVITCNEMMRSSSNYEPVIVTFYRVKFARSRSDPVVFLLDAHCFVRPDINFTVNDLTGILLFLKGRSDTDTDLSEYIDENYRSGRMAESKIRHREARDGRSALAGGGKLITLKGKEPFDPALRLDAEQYHAAAVKRHQLQYAAQEAEIVAGRYKSLEAKWLTDFLAKRREIIFVLDGSIQMYIHKSTILDKTVPRGMKLVVFNAIDPRSDYEYTVLVDTNIYDGFVSVDIVQHLSALTRTADEKAIMSFAIKRTTLLDELHDLEDLLKTVKKNGLVHGYSKIIGQVTMYPGHPSIPGYTILEYTLSDLYFQGKIIPSIARQLGARSR